jgi:hypothetical protein
VLEFIEKGAFEKHFGKAIKSYKYFHGKFLIDFPLKYWD